MSTTREDLRDHLVAVLAAAPELPEDEREHLADVFLDRLDADYQLLPRGQAVSEPGRPRPRGAPDPFIFWRAWPIPIGLIGLVLLLPLLLISAFVFVHPPIFLFALLIFLVLRSRMWRPRRRMYL